MKTTTDIGKTIQQDLIDMTKDLLRTQRQWATDLSLGLGEPYMTLKQFQTLLSYCNRRSGKRALREYIRYPLMTKDHPLYPLFQIEDQAWYVMLPSMRGGGYTGHTYAIPIRYFRPHVQNIMTCRHLSQPYDPPARLVITHYVRQARHHYHNNPTLLREHVKTQFPQYSRQTIWKAIQALSHSPISEGGPP